MARPRAIQPDKPRGTARHVLALPAVLFLAALSIAVAFVAYVLWPRWPGEAVAVNAPSVPISVAGVVFNIPPGGYPQPDCAQARHAGSH